jgi:hypothetical protein
VAISTAILTGIAYGFCEGTDFAARHRRREIMRLVGSFTFDP